MSSFSGPLVLASGNAGKLAEFRHILEDLPITLHAQDEFDVEPAEETGCTFLENALLKARAASAQTGMAALADDSGLAVAALGGAPGVKSARFAADAGVGSGDAANNRHLLARLQETPPAQRGACFICVLVLLRHADDPVPLVAQGEWQGRILEAPRGEGGFGYDPLFEVPELGLSAAQLPRAEKNRLSHRARAVRRLRQLLTDTPGA
jgi:XTP/dITP diphosphohydrolase